MKPILISSLTVIFTIVATPTTLYAGNPSGKGPTVICNAQEFIGGVTSRETQFTRYALVKNEELDDFRPITVLDGARFKLQAYGSMNSEQELWLRIEDKENLRTPSYSRGLLSGSLTRVVDWQNFARITCDQESELKERYLAGFCNDDGSVRSPEGRQNLEEIARACARLREIEVIKPAPVPPCTPTPDAPCPR